MTPNKPLSSETSKPKHLKWGAHFKIGPNYWKLLSEENGQRETQGGHFDARELSCFPSTLRKPCVGCHPFQRPSDALCPLCLTMTIRPGAKGTVWQGFCSHSATLDVDLLCAPKSEATPPGPGRNKHLAYDSNISTEHNKYGAQPSLSYANDQKEPVTLLTLSLVVEHHSRSKRNVPLSLKFRAIQGPKLQGNEHSTLLMGRKHRNRSRIPQGWGVAGANLFGAQKIGSVPCARFGPHLGLLQHQNGGPITI